MPALRYYYSDTIEAFLRKSSDEIVGMLTRAAEHDINNETTISWEEEIDILRTALAEYVGRGSVYFEYNIPRMGRRADVIVLIDGIVIVMEFKTSEQRFTRGKFKYGTMLWILRTFSREAETVFWCRYLLPQTRMTKTVSLHWHHLRTMCTIRCCQMQVD